MKGGDDQLDGLRAGKDGGKMKRTLLTVEVTERDDGTGVVVTRQPSPYSGGRRKVLRKAVLAGAALAGDPTPPKDFELEAVQEGLEAAYEVLKPRDGRTASLARMHVLAAMEHLRHPLPEDVKPTEVERMAEAAAELKVVSRGELAERRKEAALSEGKLADARRTMAMSLGNFVREDERPEALECPACSGPVYRTAIRCEACGMTSSTIHGFGGGR